MSSDEKPAKIILSLENCIIPAERLQQTPSQIDGLSTEDEMDVRLLSCEMIQHAGILLRLPQVAMATAQVIFQRFFYRKSFVKHSYEHIAMACLFMAAKIEEAPRRIRDVINVFHHIKQFKTGRSFDPMAYTGNSYFMAKSGIIKEERRVLKELGFSCHVKHPHKLITTYLQILEHEKHQQLVQRAWNYMNDSLRSNVFARFPIETIACACIHLAALKLKIQLPTNPPWYWLFDASLDDIQVVCLTILALYERKERSLAELDESIAKAKKSAATLATASNSNVNSPATLLQPPSPASQSAHISSVNSPATAVAAPPKLNSSLSANYSDSPTTISAATNSAPSSGSPNTTSTQKKRSQSPANQQSSRSTSSSNNSSDSSSGSSESNSDSSPDNHKAHSADTKRAHSPDNQVTERHRSPRRRRRQRSPTPERRRSRSPHRRQRSHSPPVERHRSRSPRRRRSKTPERRRSRSPYRSRQNGSPHHRDRETGSHRWRDRYSRGDSRFASHGDRHRDR